LHVPCSQGSDQGGPLGRGQTAQGTGGRRPQVVAGSSRLEGRASSGPAQETNRGGGWGNGRAWLPIPPPPSHGFSTKDLGADYPRPAATAHPAWADGRGLSHVRPAVPDRDCPGQAGATMSAATKLCPTARSTQEAVRTGPGEGAG